MHDAHNKALHPTTGCYAVPGDLAAECLLAAAQTVAMDQKIPVTSGRYPEAKFH